MMRFCGKVVLITGSTSGMGEVQAKMFAKEGANVIVVGRNRERAERVSKEIQADGGNAMVVCTDMRNAAALQEMVTQVLAAYGRIDVLVNNAGVFDQYAPLLKTTEELWDSVFDVNVKAAFHLCKLVLPQMIEHQQGAIVNISSIAGLVANKGGAAYTASKHAMVGLTKHLASEYAKEGIKINAICPGTIVTPLIADLVDNIPKDNVPIHRFGTPEEVASLVMFLSSDASAFMSGAIIPIDGGYTIR